MFVTHLFVLHIISSNSSWLCSVRYDHSYFLLYGLNDIYKWTHFNGLIWLTNLKAEMCGFWSSNRPNLPIRVLTFAKWTVIRSCALFIPSMVSYWLIDLIFSHPNYPTTIKSFDFDFGLSIVIPSHLQPPVDDKSSSGLDDTPKTDVMESSQMNHNYSACCSNSNVTTACLGFCHLKNILDGTTDQDPEQCEADFPAIVKCMAGMICYQLKRQPVFWKRVGTSSLIEFKLIHDSIL